MRPTPLRDPNDSGTRPPGVPGPAAAYQAERPWRWYHLAIVVAVAVATVMLWIVVPLVLRGDTPMDRMRIGDVAWQQRAEAVCAATKAEIATLPPARDARTPQERAVQVDRVNELLTAMIAGVAAVTPGTLDDQAKVAPWLDDWQTYLADRRRHADRLRAGEDARFQVTAVDNDPIERLMDDFATANSMPSCKTLRDLA